MSATATPQDVLEGRARWCVIEADCADVLATLPQVDALITDPPYGINWKPRVTHQDQTWVDDVDFDPTPWLRVGRFHLFWGAQYFATRLPNSEGWCSWVKRPLDTGDFSRDVRSYATVELAWSDFGKARFISHVWDGGMRAGAADNRSFCHPSQKPIEVMLWCIEPLPEGLVVLDPFCGSGTTGVAALRLGHRFIGIEKDAKYAAIARERLDAETKGLTLRDVRHGQRGLFEVTP